MGQVLLGLDIGTASIKGVRLTKSFRGLRLLDSFEKAVSRGEVHQDTEGPLTEGQLDALKTLISERRIQGGDLIALSLPGNLILSREVVLPFTDLKKIQQIAPYEIEGDLPFDLESVSVDYMLLKGRQYAPPAGEPDKAEPRQETRLLVSAVPKDTLGKYLDLLEPIGIDPAWIGTNPISLYSFSKYFLGVESSNTTETLIIDLGASRTVLCHTKKGHLNWIRTIPFGGDFLTESLVKALNISWEEAEEKKVEIDLNLANPTNEQSIEIEILEGSIGYIVAEIEKSIRMLPQGYNLDPSVNSPEEIEGYRKLFHLCGGGGALKGFEALLSNILEMEPIAIDVEKGGLVTAVSGVEMVPPEYVSQVYAQAFGLALQESDGPPINFRQGTFVFGKKTIERRHRLFTFSLLTLFLLGLMGGDFYLHYQSKENRYQTLKKELRVTFTEIFPNTRNVVNEVEQTRAGITELKKTSTFLGVGESSPLTVLKKITEAIPDKIKIDVFNIVIDGGSIRIQAQTDSFESVDRIRSGIESANYFTQVEVSDAKATANKSHVRFRIKTTVQKEETGGKNRPF